ncbi:tyrosine-protein phosphatase [Naumannella halotolerans]|uniref:Protein-tyrosine phosphatase n=1 Tax=Naumannella halotolerans TaxID=993414 RepID=A0A4V3EMS5_9ACTN|nr:tyrosine-protein phosphatase [Naumannella halotolerans]TDT30948.1 protein-tyrosine phosphatase [Naumannella halotolerans]
MTTIDGTVNFRDIGGLPRRDGGRTPGGVLFRSDTLATVTDTGLSQFAATGIATVIDLRTPAERDSAPDRLPPVPEPRVVDLPLLEGAVAQMISMPSEELQIPTLGELYIDLLGHAGPVFAEVATIVGESGDGVLVHCSAGKDRTGVAIAVLLDAVGVDRAAVVADYAASTERLAGPWAEQVIELIKAFGIDPTPELITLATTSPPEAIKTALSWLDEQGGTRAYLLDHGATAEQLDRLGARLRA